MEAHAPTARALAKWQAQHSEQMEALVDWTTTHPYEAVDMLFSYRSGWDELRTILRDDQDGAFVRWVRRAPHAAREMAFYSNGLAFLDSEVPTLLRAGYTPAARRANPLLASPTTGR
jgi:hypothetical protein